MLNGRMRENLGILPRNLQQNLKFGLMYFFWFILPIWGSVKWRIWLYMKFQMDFARFYRYFRAKLADKFIEVQLYTLRSICGQDSEIF